MVSKGCQSLPESATQAALKLAKCIRGCVAHGVWCVGVLDCLASILGPLSELPVGRWVPAYVALLTAEGVRN